MRDLDVFVLHKLILEEMLGIDEDGISRKGRVEFIKDHPRAVSEAMARIDAGEKRFLFLMNPVTVEQLKAVTDAGERMPQKSTFFYPKLYSGLTIYKM
jgi:uncharacterized protein (DUF1015 family)